MLKLTFTVPAVVLCLAAALGMPMSATAQEGESWDPCLVEACDISFCLSIGFDPDSDEALREFYNLFAELPRHRRLDRPRYRRFRL